MFKEDAISHKEEMASSLNKLDDQTLKLVKEAKNDTCSIQTPSEVKTVSLIAMLVMTPSASLLESYVSYVSSIV